MEEVKEEKVNELVVAKPEDWPMATEVKSKTTLDTPNGPMIFNLRAISYGEQREIEDQNPLPEAPLKRVHGHEYRDSDDQSFKDTTEVVNFARRIAKIDKCWLTKDGTGIPGATLVEKTKWAGANLYRSGEIAKLNYDIIILSGWGMGAPIPPEKKVAVEADPANWAKASQSRFGYRIKQGDRFLVFNLGSLSQLRINQIKDSCRPLPPPNKPKMHPATKRPIPGSEEPDFFDVAYKQRVKNSEVHETTLQLEEALFKFPGNSVEEKALWLDARPAFEVMLLNAFLGNNVIAYRDRSDFI